jgi:hypothetical protein
LHLGPAFSIPTSLSISWPKRSRIPPASRTRTCCGNACSIQPAWPPPCSCRTRSNELG